MTPPPRGSNQVGLGQFNERVVLQALRVHGPLPKAQIARLTHLTAQTVALIIVRLTRRKLVRKCAPLRGRVGQPSVPIALDPDGAFGIGVHVGRRRMDLLLVAFVGAVRHRSVLDYSFPEPDAVVRAVARDVRTVHKKLGAEDSRRLQGIGMAAPLSLGGWRELLGISAARAARWDEIDIGARIGARSGLPVHNIKDTAAACVAELVAGRGREIGSYAYFFVDTFIGGGLVLDHRLYRGAHGNAGAVGSMPLGVLSPGSSSLGRIASRAARQKTPSPSSIARGAVQTPPQLLSQASLFRLEAMLAAAGLPLDVVRSTAADGQRRAAVVRRWLRDAAPAIAHAVQSVTSVLDVNDVIVDVAVSRELLDDLLRAVDRALERHSWEGVARPRLRRGDIGSDARALGAALLPIYANYAPERGTLSPLAPSTNFVA